MFYRKKILYFSNKIIYLIIHEFIWFKYLMSQVNDGFGFENSVSILDFAIDLYIFKSNGCNHS